MSLNLFTILGYFILHEAKSLICFADVRNTVAWQDMRQDDRTNQEVAAFMRIFINFKDLFSIFGSSNNKLSKYYNVSLSASNHIICYSDYLREFPFELIC